MRFDVLNIAGYAEAVEAEGLARDAAFLPVNEFIAGFEVRPMNLTHYLALKIAGNHLAVGPSQERPTLEQLAQFIWCVSVDYRPSVKAQERWFKRKFRHLLEPKQPWLHTPWAVRRYERRLNRVVELQNRAVLECQAYMKETLRDLPKRAAGPFKAPYFSDGAFWCGLLGRECKASRAEVLTMPLKQLFQFLNEAKVANGKAHEAYNPSDEIKADWQREQARLRAANAAT